MLNSIKKWIIPLLILSFIVCFHEAGHMIAAKIQGVFVEEFSIGFPPHILSVQIGETKYSLGIIPLGGYVKVAGEEDSATSKDDPRSMDSLSSLGKILVLVSGVVANIILTCLILAVLISRGLTIRMTYYDVFGEKMGASPNMPPPYEDWLREGHYVGSKNGEPVILSYKNDPNAPDIQAQRITLDILLKERFLTVFFHCLHPINLLRLMAVVGTGLVNKTEMAKDKPSGSLVGPIGILKLTAKSIQNGPEYLFFFVSDLSFSIGLLNIIPIPPLDGGKILVVLMGGILPQFILTTFAVFGTLLLLGLIFYTIVNDLKR